MSRTYWDGGVEVTRAGLWVGAMSAFALIVAVAALTWWGLENRGSAAVEPGSILLPPLDPLPAQWVDVLQPVAFECDVEPRCNSTGTWRFIDTVTSGVDSSRSYEFLVNLSDVDGSISGSAISFRITGRRVGPKVHLDFVGPSSTGHFDLLLTAPDVMRGTFEDTAAKNGGTTGASREGPAGRVGPVVGVPMTSPAHSTDPVAAQDDAIRNWLKRYDSSRSSASERYIGRCPPFDAGQVDPSLFAKICATRLQPTPEGRPVFTLTWFNSEPGGPLLLLQVDAQGTWGVIDDSVACVDGTYATGAPCRIPAWAVPYQAHRPPTPASGGPGGVPPAAPAAVSPTPLATRPPSPPSPSPTPSGRPAPASVRWQNPVMTSTGLLYEDVVAGSGPVPQSGQKVTVEYVIRLENGSQVDSTYERGAGLSFTIGASQVIKGFDEGVGGMRVGGRRLLRIPASLGYGALSPGKGIPANAVLEVDIVLLSTTSTPLPRGDGTYTVKASDLCGTIASDNGITLQRLLDANLMTMDDCLRLTVGQVLLLR